MRSLLLILALAAASLSSAGAPKSKLAVVVVGDGGSTVGNLPVTIRQYTVAGVQVGSDLSLSNIGGRNLTASFGETSEGGLQISGDKRYLMLAGYDLPVRDGAFSPTASPRVIARMALNGTIELSQAFFPSAGDGVRAVYSPDGNSYWTTGGDMGIYNGTFTTTPSQVLPEPFSTRSITAFGGIYYFTGSGAFEGLNGAGSWDGQNYSPLFETPIGSIRDIYMIDANTLYVSGASGICKMTKSGGVWSVTYSLTGQNVGHFTVDGDKIYGASNNGSLLLAGRDNGSGFDAWTTIATAAANTRFRGVELMPKLQSIGRN
ncbi:MAG: hypothetical protein WAO58_13500 [Fimbriimonadaceae bacterium]